MSKRKNLPERDTKSLNDNPTSAKLDLRTVIFDEGAGMNTLAAVLLAVRESLLPNLTSHVGPPSCTF